VRKVLCVAHGRWSFARKVLDAKRKEIRLARESKMLAARAFSVVRGAVRPTAAREQAGGAKVPLAAA